MNSSLLSTTLKLAALTLAIAQAAFSYGTTYVSRYGSDSVNCGINVAPCYSLQAALLNTDPGGTVKVLDANAVAPSGIVIKTPVTIDGSGLAVIENIFSPGSPAILVSANCTLRNMIVQVTTGDGIEVNAANTQVNVENVQIEGKPSAFANGVHVTATGVTLNVEGLAIEGPSTGISIGGADDVFYGKHIAVHAYTTAGIVIASGKATIRESAFSGADTGAGEVGISVSGATLLADKCELTNNAIGALADGAGGAAVLRIGDSIIAANATGLNSVNGGQIISFRTNMIAGNGSDGAQPLGTSLK